MNILDSYNEFLGYFDIEKSKFYQFGLDYTIFPRGAAVNEEWDSLKERLFKDQPVYIRGYGRDAHGTQDYQDFYAYLFGNNNVLKDPTNNARPQALIQRLTGYKRNKTVFNYQVSHIWGHTKNPLLFEAPWNICLTPKIIDPFTGHETKGNWPAEYQELFVVKAHSLYKPYIDDYNSVIDQLNLPQKLEDYLSKKTDWDSKRVKRFRSDVLREFSKID